jgi:hypothetical protein
MADDTASLDLTIVFKSGQSVRYMIGAQELDRLATAFENSNRQGSTSIGVYDVADDSGNPRRLMLRFADVLYIG